MALPFNRDYLFEQYNVKQRSIAEIASEWNTYPSKIRRAMIKFDMVIRNISTANILAVKNGKKIPKGSTGHSEETKKKISKSVIATWERRVAEADPSIERAKSVAKRSLKIEGKKAFNEFRNTGAEQVRLTKMKGSLIVNYLVDELNKVGLESTFEKTPFPIDIISGDGKVIIVIDGHFRNTKKNAEEKFRKRNEVLFAQSFEKIIIVRYHDKFLKISSSRKLLEKIRSALSHEDRIFIFNHPEIGE